MMVFYEGLKYGMIVGGIVTLLGNCIRYGIKMINHFK